MKYDIADRKLAAAGRLRVEWAERNMPVLRLIRERFNKDKPLKGLRIGCCLHVTTETANLMRTLKAGGARLALCASNPLSTQDDVAAALVVDHKISVFAVRGENNKRYYRHIDDVLDIDPHITIDDGADLVSSLHKRETIPDHLLGGLEETTTGVIRLRAMEKDGALRFPMVAINDSNTKHFFDNRYGTGQSTIDGILRATNMLIAGSTVVIAGYGWCGRGLGTRTKGMGANVIITEVDPLKALEAVMDGFQVMPMSVAARTGDLFITVTGNLNVLRAGHFKRMKDGAIVCNSGHFNAELDLPALSKMTRKKREIRHELVEYTLTGGKRINVLAEGRLVNLAAAEGHPAMVMDMSFANQALGVEHLKEHGGRLANHVYPMPAEIDNEIARLKLLSMAVKIDRLTPEQKKYLASWEMGT
jgi:adenosylhomocysteinase